MTINTPVQSGMLNVTRQNFHPNPNCTHIIVNYQAQTQVKLVCSTATDSWPSLSVLQQCVAQCRLRTDIVNTPDSTWQNAHMSLPSHSEEGTVLLPVKPDTHYPFIRPIYTGIWDAFWQLYIYGPYVRVTGTHYPFIRAVYTCIYACICVVYRSGKINLWID